MPEKSEGYRTLARFASKILHIAMLGLFAQLSLMTICLAEEDPLAGLKDSTMADTSTGFTSGYYGNLLWVIIVLAVIIGLIIMVIRFLAQKNRSWMGNRAIRLLGGVALGQNKSLQIVEIGRSLYLIGVGENVQLLEKVEQPEEVSEIKHSLTLTAASGENPFSPLLAKLLKRASFSKSAGKDTVLDTSSSDKTPTDTAFQTIFQAKMETITAKRKKFVDEILQDDNSKERSNE